MFCRMKLMVGSQIIFDAGLEPPKDWQLLGCSRAMQMTPTMMDNTTKLFEKFIFRFLLNKLGSSWKVTLYSLSLSDSFDLIDLNCHLYICILWTATNHSFQKCQTGCQFTWCHYRHRWVCRVQDAGVIELPHLRWKISRLFACESESELLYTLNK